jgi:hypothetical protein
MDYTAIGDPIPAECLRCGHGTLTIYPGGAYCSNCSPQWLETMLIDHMAEWKKLHAPPSGSVTGG